MTGSGTHHGEQVTACGPAAAMRDFHTVSGEMRELRVVNRHLATTKEESHRICGTHTHTHTKS